MKRGYLFIALSLVTILFFMIGFHFSLRKDVEHIAYAQSQYEIEDFEIELEEQEFEYIGDVIPFQVEVFYKEQKFEDFTVFYFNETYDITQEPPINVGEYNVKIKVNDSEIEWETQFTIHPKGIYIEFAGPSTYQYYRQEFSRTISPIGLIGDEEAGISFLYIGETTTPLEINERPTEADTYTVEIYLSNNNYAIIDYIGNEPRYLEISKGTLTAKAEDLVVNPGDPLDFDVTISGFIDGESIEDITQPNVLFTEDPIPGIYTIIPSGGKAANYKFLYQSGTLTINKLSITDVSQDGLNGITIVGTFDPNYILSFKSLSNTDESYINAMETIAERRMSTYLDKTLYAFDTFESEGGKKHSSRLQITITNIELKTLIYKYKILIVDENEIVHEISNYNYTGDTISFATDVMGTICIVERQLRTYLFLGIAVGLTIIILAFILLTQLKYRIEKKQIEQEIRDKKNKRNEYRWY